MSWIDRIREITKAEVNQIEAEKRAEEERESLRHKQENQERARVLEGNRRGREIAFESGAVRLFQDARNALAESYPSATLEGTYRPGEDRLKTPYIIKLAWYKDSHKRERVDFEGYYYYLVEATCDGFKNTIRIGSKDFNEDEWKNDTQGIKEAIVEAIKQPQSPTYPPPPESFSIHGLGPGS